MQTSSGVHYVILQKRARERERDISAKATSFRHKHTKFHEHIPNGAAVAPTSKVRVLI
jgi:hypothetical protein